MSVEFTVYKGSASEGIVQATTNHPLPKGNQVLPRGRRHREQIGESVTDLKVGDVVGWGYIHDVCGKCEECLHGDDQYCRNKEQYGDSNHHQGSFGSRAIWNADWLYKVPAGLKPEHAAPLMCGGATVFGVIETYNIRPTDRVGVVGIGGLGHLAIQFLAKMGATVVVFSSTESKREEALKKLDVPELDHLIVTASFLPNWQLYVARPC
ncbi:chaperonin 10-like protein [Roridomyces roridus]|uniref:Chaperonin 10-like protein n=1 Tax=Roridomyces roridus TaxID=1738132 RepID=A0AAD7CEC5_9AGAR|nr:chaperonin 10-like protein [Roridomyces roridus]